MKEPERDSSLESLWQPMALKVSRVLFEMRSRGYDPIVFEARRSIARQEWLYGVGRSHDLKRKPVTWTLSSRHLVGKAVDIVSKSRGWNWLGFFGALQDEGRNVGLCGNGKEEDHLEWNG